MISKVSNPYMSKTPMNLKWYRAVLPPVHKNSVLNLKTYLNKYSLPTTKLWTKYTHTYSFSFLHAWETIQALQNLKTNFTWLPLPKEYIKMRSKMIGQFSSGITPFLSYKSSSHKAENRIRQTVKGTKVKIRLTLAQICKQYRITACGSHTYNGIYSHFLSPIIYDVTSASPPNLLVGTTFCPCTEFPYTCLCSWPFSLINPCGFNKCPPIPP